MLNPPNGPINFFLKKPFLLLLKKRFFCPVNQEFFCIKKKKQTLLLKVLSFFCWCHILAFVTFTSWWPIWQGGTDDIETHERMGDMMCHDCFCRIHSDNLQSVDFIFFLFAFGQSIQHLLCPAFLWHIPGIPLKSKFFSKNWASWLWECTGVVWVSYFDVFFPLFKWLFWMPCSKEEKSWSTYAKALPLAGGGDVAFMCVRCFFFFFFPFFLFLFFPFCIFLSFFSHFFLHRDVS